MAEQGVLWLGAGGAWPAPAVAAGGLQPLTLMEDLASREKRLSLAEIFVKCIYIFIVSGAGLGYVFFWRLTLSPAI